MGAGSRGPGSTFSSVGRQGGEAVNALAWVPGSLASKPGSVSDSLRELLQVTHPSACHIPQLITGNRTAPREGGWQEQTVGG